MVITLILCDIGIDGEKTEADKSVELGSYEYVNCFLNTISSLLENGKWGSKYPILMESLDAKTKIDPETAEELCWELEDVKNELKKFSPDKIDCTNIETEESNWMLEAPFDTSADNIYDYFLTMDENNLTATFYDFAKLAFEENKSLMYLYD